MLNPQTRHRIFVGFIAVLILMCGWMMGRNYEHRTIKRNLDILLEPVLQASHPTKISYVTSLIERDYVDSISSDSLAELAIPAILKELDPHSVYIPAREFKDTEEPLQGEFDGIGVVFNMATDTVIVLNVVPSGPSQKAGILGGDRILYVNDTLIAGQKMSTTAVMKRLRGPRGTRVRLGVERRGIRDTVVITVVRDAIPLHSVEATVMLNDHIGFIRLSQFARTSYSEIVKSIEQLRKQGMTSLILDLRGNSGGFLDQATRIANEFLPKDKLIVYTEDRHHSQEKLYTDGRGRATDLLLAILIDESSASSSEILAGAIQDNDRGVIVGRRSFGKGLVQSQLPFSDGSAIRLTVARYYTPTGRSIQKPYVPGQETDYQMDIVKRFNNNEFFSADSIRFADSLRFTTPKGRTVYGGGGIMPDRFIPLDTVNVTKYFAEVSGKNILYKYTIEYADSHREALSRAATVQDIEKMFRADPGLFSRFVEYASKAGVAPSWNQISRSRKIMEAQIKAYIARNSDLDNSALYYFLFPIDHTMQEAVKELDKMQEQ